MSRRPIALEAYERMAEAFAAQIDAKPHNAYYERPATLSLLPAVKGKRVLDAGCGPGVYSQWLADRGADVIAVDVSPTMIELAKKRVGDKATFRQAELGKALDFIRDEEIDIVLSALAMDYVEDWGIVFQEFMRVLVPTGHLVFSAGHPFADFLRYRSENYFKTERVEMEWTGFGTPVVVPSYRRSLGSVLNPMLKAGFRLETLIEPRPTEEFRKVDPEGFDDLSRRPGFICIRARKA
jgi:SAM-dependent methyltransferase